MTEFHWTEVNGVATIWTEAPEPLHAELWFRTGRADETLITAGHTHLIEHMALTGINESAKVSNGFVGGIVTGFSTMGSPDDVTAFLLRVCKALRFLPADRLEPEKKILSRETASRQYDVCGNLLMWRFGAVGHGLIGMPEFGIRGATLEQLQEWGIQRFTSGNAVLWLSGPLPADLRLELPHGEKQPLPPLTPMEPAFPSWFVDNMCNGVAAGATVPRVAASTIFRAIAAKRLHERLRIEKAVSYAPSVFYEPLNADTAHLVLYADSDQNRRAELTKAFGEIFERLTEIDDDEVDTTRRLVIETWTGSLAPPLSDRAVDDARRAALDWLLGQEFESIESLAAEASSVTATDVAVFGRDMQNTSMIALPGKAIVQPWMGQEAGLSLRPAVKGREIHYIDAPVQRDRLVHGPDGVSLKLSDGSCFTVRYSELEAALHYEDGCVVLIGHDATCVTIEPTLWRNGLSVCREICERIPAHLLLEQDPRSADAIPKPKTSLWQRLHSSLTWRR